MTQIITLTGFSEKEKKKKKKKRENCSVVEDIRILQMLPLNWNYKYSRPTQF